MSDTDRAPQSAPPETSVPPDQPEPADASETTPELATLQQWFQAVIMHPDGVTAGISSPAAREQIDVGPADVERVITRSQSRTSEQRLAVYANAYYARLLECLGNEFPALKEAVGDEAFESFSFGYLQEFPSTSYTLAELGRDFPKYLRESRPETGGERPWWMDFVIDLATYERVCSEVFDAPGPEGQPELSLAELEGVPPEAWSTARLGLVKPLRLLHFRFPVHEYVTAVRGGESPSPPAAAPTWLAVSRRDYVVRRLPLTAVQFALLEALEAGHVLGDALAAAVETSLAVQADTGNGAGDDLEVAGELATQLGGWFREWAASGLIRAVHAG